MRFNEYRKKTCKLYLSFWFELIGVSTPIEVNFSLSFIFSSSTQENADYPCIQNTSCNFEKYPPPFEKTSLEKMSNEHNVEAKCKTVYTVLKLTNTLGWENFNLVGIISPIFIIIIHPAKHLNMNMSDKISNTIISFFFHLSQICWKVQKLMLMSTSMQPPASQSFHDAQVPSLQPSTLVAFLQNNHSKNENTRYFRSIISIQLPEDNILIILTNDIKGKNINKLAAFILSETLRLYLVQSILSVSCAKVQRNMQLFFQK